MGDGREEKKEEGKPAASICRPDGRVAERGPQAKVSNPSSIIGPENVHFLSLKFGLPMSGPTPEPRVRSNLNPAAEELEPWPSLFRCAFSSWDVSGWSLGSAPHGLALPSARAESKRGSAGGVSGVQPEGC